MPTSFGKWLRALKIGLSISAFGFLAIFFFSFRTSSGQPARISPSVAHSPATPRITITQRPLAFEPNRGQTADAVKYLAHGPGYELFVTDRELVLTVARADPKAALSQDQRPGAIPARDRFQRGHFTRQMMRIRLASGARRPAFEATAPMPGRVNYFIGNDPKKWRTKIPLYGRVIEHSVWPGIDVAWYGNQHQLESDFIVAPHADPAAIQFTVDEASKLAVDADGNLAMGPLKLLKPVVYQGDGAHRRVIAGRYALSRAGAARRRVSFVVAAYDHAKPLVIDPTVALDYSTYLGGSGASGDGGTSIAVDTSGSSYVTGFTSSTDFPLQNPFESSFSSAFVTKFSPDGTSLVYSSYLDGAFSTAIAVDSSGSAYLTGSAGSGFPLKNPFQSSSGSAFVTKFSADGSSLVYSTYLGGSGGDEGTGIAVDSSGEAYVTGDTSSVDFPLKNPFRSSPRGLFVTKFSADGGSLIYSTYLGGSGGDSVAGNAVDPSGDAYVTGSTSSADFPLKNPFQAALKGTQDAFVTEFSPAGNTLVYSSYLGGSGGFGGDRAAAIAVDSGGNAYVTGTTASSDFPTVNAIQASRSACTTACNPTGFVTKINAGGGSLRYSTYLGDDPTFSYDQTSGYGIAVDPTGSAYVTGQTLAFDFPILNAFQPGNNGTSCTFLGGFGCGNAFVAQFSIDGRSLVYSTYLGGSGNGRPGGEAAVVGDLGRSIAVDASGNAYVTGLTASIDFPTKNPFQSSNHNPGCPTVCGTNAFVAKFAAFSPIPTLTPTPSTTATPTPTATTVVTGSPAKLSFGKVDATATSKTKELTLNNEGAVAAQIGQIVPPASFVISDDTCSNTMLAVEAKCTVDLAAVPATVGAVSAALTIPYNGTSPSVTLEGEGLTVTLKAPKSVTLPSTAAGTDGAAKSFTIKNKSDAAVTIVGHGLDTFYRITSDGCANGLTLAPNTECVETLVFTPPAGSSGTLTGGFTFDFSYGVNNGSVTTTIKGKVKS